MLVTSMTLAVYTYMLSDESRVRIDLDISQIFIRLVAGFTEPDDGTWFKTFSTGFSIVTSDWNRLGVFESTRFEA